MEKRSKIKKKQAVGLISGNPYRQSLLIKSDSKEEMEGGGKKPSLSLPGLTVPAFILLNYLDKRHFAQEFTILFYLTIT
jgi:hypothetical protein